jgi:rubredoxin
MARNILCYLFGHKWGAQARTPWSRNPKEWFKTYCKRCGVEKKDE